MFPIIALKWGVPFSDDCRAIDFMGTIRSFCWLRGNPYWSHTQVNMGYLPQWRKQEYNQPEKSCSSIKGTTSHWWLTSFPSFPGEAKTKTQSCRSSSNCDCRKIDPSFLQLFRSFSSKNPGFSTSFSIPSHPIRHRATPGRSPSSRANCSAAPPAARPNSKPPTAAAGGKTWKKRVSSPPKIRIWCHDAIIFFCFFTDFFNGEN